MQNGQCNWVKFRSFELENFADSKINTMLQDEHKYSVAHLSSEHFLEHFEQIEIAKNKSLS